MRVGNMSVPAVQTRSPKWCDESTRRGRPGGPVTGALVAGADVYPPKEIRNTVQAAVTVIVLAAFATLVWLRTADLLAELS
jgi:hypothetical protein